MPMINRIAQSAISEKLKGARLSDLETPALLVDLDAMEQNLATMARFFNGPVKLRPHFKNHRVVELARRQLESGAIGITCARLWEAELLVHNGITNVLIANEIAGQQMVKRFVELARESSVIVAVDSNTTVNDLAFMGRQEGAEVNVVVDVDLGLHRCGVKPGEPALALARMVIERGLKFRGLMGYEGHLQALDPGDKKDREVRSAIGLLVDSKRMIEEAGIPVEIVSCGGTGDFRIAGQVFGVTENQAGSFMLMDSWYEPFAPDFKPALSVLATVISKTAGERIVVDSGIKALSGERGLPTVKNNPGLRLKALHAEHAVIETTNSSVLVDVGNKIEIWAQYHDGTVHLHQCMYGIRNEGVEEVFEIEH
jgi:D-serine deaminase-like pyridoxal phosphate-dependent protein